MKNDYETGSDKIIYIEIFFEKNSFKAILNKYVSQVFEEWYLIGNPHEMIGKEFDSHAILLYPLQNVSKSLLNIFSQKIKEFDSFREVMNTPYIWLSSLTFRLNNNILTLGKEYKLNYFHGIDIISENLNKYGVLIIQKDDCEVELSVELHNPMDRKEVIKGFRLILATLKLYNKIRKEQEDLIVQNLSQYLKTLDLLYENG